MGLRLLLVHPELPSCEDCQAYLYSDRWELSRKGGQPVARPKGIQTPCYRCPKIPPGTEPKPANAINLSERNYAAYWYAQQCQVDNTGVLPRDKIVVRNNTLVQMVKEQIARSNEGELPMLMLGLMSQGRRR
jgi:hypothetical protein